MLIFYIWVKVLNDHDLYAMYGKKYRLMYDCTLQITNNITRNNTTICLLSEIMSIPLFQD
jgi:hypothetical protein